MAGVLHVQSINEADFDMFDDSSKPHTLNTPSCHIRRSAAVMKLPVIRQIINLIIIMTPSQNIYFTITYTRMKERAEWHT